MKKHLDCAKSCDTHVLKKMRGLCTPYPGKVGPRYHEIMPHCNKRADITKQIRISAGVHQPSTENIKSAIQR